MDCRILAQKLKDARTRRCHMIFDGFSPDQDDQIHLDGIDEHLGYLHPDSAACLAAFFQSFYTQTQRDKMNRKYFTANMLTALERNKFNLQTLFQDPDILELERRLLLIQEQYLASSMMQGEAESIYETNQILGPEIQENENEVREFIVEEQKQPQSENVKKSRIESQSTAPDMNALQSENLLSFYMSQRQNYKKLQTYMKRHFGLESDLQKSINYSRDIDFAEKDNLSVSLILKDQHNEKTIRNNSHRHSVPFLEEITAGYKQSAKDSKPKISYAKGTNLDTFPETIQNTESDPLSSLSLRTLRGISLEALANMNSLNLGSLRGSYMQEKLMKPLFSEQNCHHYLGKQTYQKLTESAKRQSLDTHKDSIVSMPVTNNTPKFSKVLEKSSKIVNKKGSFSDNKAPQTSYHASSKSNLTSIQSSRRSSQINHKETVDLPMSSVSERPSKKVATQNTNRGENRQRDIRKPTTTPTKPVFSTSFCKSDKKGSILEQQRKSIQDRRLSYNPVLEAPVRRDSSFSGVKNGVPNNGTATGNRYNKENNYNFSFTEREILEGQTC